MSDETEIKLVATDYVILDKEDVKQIESADAAVKSEFVYMYKGKLCLTYMGIKHLVLKMSQKEEPLEFIGMPEIILMKYDETNEMRWVWQAMVKVRNIKTRLESIGVSEHSFMNTDKGAKYDIFGRTLAISKAERNAFRKQISELEINLMLASVGPENIRKLEPAVTVPMNTKPGPVDPRYIEKLKNLGFTGPAPKTSYEAGILIAELEKTAPMKEKMD